MHVYFRYFGKHRKAQNRNLKITLILTPLKIMTFKKHFGDCGLDQ